MIEWFLSLLCKATLDGSVESKFWLDRTLRLRTFGVKKNADWDAGNISKHSIRIRLRVGIQETKNWADKSKILGKTLAQKGQEGFLDYEYYISSSQINSMK